MVGLINNLNENGNLIIIEIFEKIVNYLYKYKASYLLFLEINFVDFNYNRGIIHIAVLRSIRWFAREPNTSATEYNSPVRTRGHKCNNLQRIYHFFHFIFFYFFIENYTFFDNELSFSHFSGGVSKKKKIINRSILLLVVYNNNIRVEKIQIYSGDTLTFEVLETPSSKKYILYIERKK